MARSLSARMSKKRPTYEDIVREVHELLHESGEVELAHRRQCVFRMAEAQQAWRDRRTNSPGFRMRSRGLALTVTQGRAMAAGRTLNTSVELLGNNIGSISFSPGRSPSFAPKFRQSESWEWSKSKKHGRLISEYVKEQRERIGETSQPERTIQSQLFEALRAPKRRESALRCAPGLVGYQPVEFAGCMMEFPTAVAGSVGVKLGAGTVDLLVRQGGGRSTTFLVFEIKAPGVRDVRKTLEQALRYSAALGVLANEDARLRTAYRAVLGSKGCDRLKFGAVAVLEDPGEGQFRERAASELRALEVPDDTIVKVLLYRAPELRLDYGGMSWIPPRSLSVG